MKNNLLPVAKEGWSYIIGSIFFFILFGLLDCSFLQFFAFLATLFFTFVFRNPEREYPYYQNGSVTAPVDGVILSIEELKDSEYAYKVEINSNYINVGLLRTPFKSQIKNISKINGSRLSLKSQLAKSINENIELTFVNEESNSIKVSHRLKQSFTNIHIKPQISKSLNQGSRYGVMVNGLTTLYLPQNFRLNISVGSELNASETLIGYFTEA